MTSNYFYKKMMFFFSKLNIMHQPVICNHASPSPYTPPLRILAGDFYFLSHKSLLKSAHCGDSQLIKPRLFSPLDCNVLYCTDIHKSLAFLPTLRGQCKSKNRAPFHGYPLPAPGLGGMVTNDWCIKWSLLKKHFCLKSTI